MEFRIIFTGTSSIARGVERSIGLDLVDKVRQEIGLPNLPLSCFDAKVPADAWYQVVIPVTEADARASGLFLDTGEKAIDVAWGALDKYLFVDFRVQKQDDGQVNEEGVNFFYSLDVDRIRTDWIAGGYTLP